MIYYIDKSDPLVLVFLIAAFTSFMVSYIRARAESLGIDCNGGIAERSERLIITLTAYGLTGLSVDYAMSIGIWSVAILSIITILQRLMIVYKAVK
ncbi:CDP-diacylglycerol--inositol 3-phosphatidyltransferase [Actinomycetota bacterium]|nr:CDP-diacylglycerol--inositol 3-phosphatidyltransferase [Actinomycetota bacterium]